MKLRNIFLLVLAVFLIASCAPTYKITSDYERGVNFSTYKTFQIIKQKNEFPLGANPINKQRIDRAILKEMNALKYEAAEEPDLLVAWFVKVKTIRDVNIYHDYYGRWYYSTSWVDVNEYQEGTLVIDLIDRVKKQVVWHGAASGRVYEDMPDVENKINEAVNAMFKEFAKDAKLDHRYASN